MGGGEGRGVKAFRTQFSFYPGHVIRRYSVIIGGIAEVPRRMNAVRALYCCCQARPGLWLKGRSAIGCSFW